MFQNDIIYDFLVECVVTRNLSAIPKNWKGIAKPITIQQRVTIQEGHQQGPLDLELQVHDPALDQGLGLLDEEEWNMIDHPQGMNIKLGWLISRTFHFSQKMREICQCKSFKAQKFKKSTYFFTEGDQAVTA